MKVTVDNSEGGDPQFADQIATGLRDQGMDVDVREPAPSSVFDTGIHLVSAGVAIRLHSRPGDAEMAAIERVVRETLLHRPSQRRRMRSVPVHVGESARPFEWIDVIE